MKNKFAKNFSTLSVNNKLVKIDNTFLGKLQSLRLRCLYILIKFSKAQLSKIFRLGDFLGALLGKFTHPLMNVTIPLVKNLVVPLATMAPSSEIDGVIQKRKFVGEELQV